MGGKPLDRDHPHQSICVEDFSTFHDTGPHWQCFLIWSLLKWEYSVWYAYSIFTNKLIRHVETRRDRPKPEVGKTSQKRLVYTRARSILTQKQNIHQRVLPWMVSGNWEAKKRRMTTATNAIHRPISPLHMYKSHVRADFQEVSSSQTRTGRREIERILVSWCGTWQGRAVLPQVAKEWLWQFKSKIWHEKSSQQVGPPSCSVQHQQVAAKQRENKER